MKIVIVASLAYSLVNFRRQLLLDLRAQGHEVIACAPDDDEEVVAALSAFGVRFRSLPLAPAGLNPLTDLKTLLSLINLFRQERPGLVIAYTQKPIIYSGIAARFTSHAGRFCPIVTGLGRAFSERGGVDARLLRKLVGSLYRLAFARAAAIVVFNPQDAADLRTVGAIRPYHEVTFSPGSGVDLTRFGCSPVPPGPPVFLMIARLLGEKGVAEFAAAAARVHNRFPAARFQLLGPFEKGRDAIPEATLDAWVAKGPLEYLGATDDVRPYLARATALVLPTFYREGVPRSILEGMATGRPIITTDIPACRVAVRDGDNGMLVAPRDSRALAGAMEQFCRQPGLARAMGRRSRLLAERKFGARAASRITLGAVLPANFSARPCRQHALADLRSAELVLGTLLCVALLPVALLAALMVAASLGRPILFRQWRAGLDGKPFSLVKFRTMSNGQDAQGRLLPDAERLRPCGRLLRRLRMDEIPELWNVLRGDMAIIGPRPLMPASVAEMGPAGNRRGAVRPGLTGWAQVNGNARLGVHDKLVLDLWYIEHRSLRLDLQILMRTIRTVLFGEHIDDLQLGRAHARAFDWRG